MPISGRSQKFTWLTTATGITTSTARFDTGMSAASIQYDFNTGTALASTSTKTVVWKAQGSIGPSAIWADLMAVTSSTGSGTVSSTVSVTFDRVRINITANNTTGDVSGVWWVAAR